MRFRLRSATLVAIYTICLLACCPAWAQLDPILYEQGFQTRKRQLINNMADQYATRAPGYANGGGSVPDPEKFNWPAVCALFDKYGLNNDTANARIYRFANNSPFHFTLVGMARIMAQYAQAPAMMATRNQYLQNVWNRTDSYNCFTGEGTENHNNMSKTSGYLYAQYSLNNSSLPQAATRLAEMKAWIQYWSRLISSGGHGEWNSSTYNTWSVAGWLNLYDFALDPDVKLCARAVLDYYAIEQALSYCNGVTAGPEMRGNALQSVATDTDFLNWLWYDDNPATVGQRFFTARGNSRISATYAAVSSYRPPLMAVELARKSLATKCQYRIGNPDYLIQRQGFIPIHFYIDPAFTLSSACMPYGGFTGGDYQANSFKLVSRVANGDSTATAQVITGSGRYYSTTGGKARHPYDQYAQVNNVVAQMTNVPSNDVALYGNIQTLITNWKTAWQPDFTSRFPSDGKPNPVSNLGATVANIYRNANYMSWPKIGIQVVRRGKVLFLALEKTFVAIRSIGQDSVAIRAENGTRNMAVDSAAYGSLCGLLLEARGASEFTSFANFQDSVLTKTSLDKTTAGNNVITYRNLKGENIEVTYQPNGSFQEPIYDWGYGVTTPSINQNLSAWQAPSWPTGVGSGRIPSWKVNGQAVNLSNYQGIAGPNVQFANNNMRLIDGSRFYNIDHSGQVPVFTTNTTALAGSATGVALEPVIYPNPADKVFQIAVFSEQSSKMLVSLFTTEGKLVKRYGATTLAESGSQQAQFSLEDVVPGIYMCRIDIGNKRWSKRLVVR